ncbi:MAG TPA: ABC transporter permease, partial [Gemmatimonadaceae bacterium]|nr:ABC transporter permease [Gemmatimonadaceae bacterium]
MPFPVRAYRALLRLLLPPRFRTAFAEEMTLVFADVYEEALRSGGCTRGARVFLAELPDLVRLANRERRAERTERAHMAIALTTPLQEQSMMDSLVQDLRFTARSLVKSPAFTIVAVMTLALGVGANTAIFSLVNGVLLKPLALPEPERLVALGEVPRDAAPGQLNSTSPGSYYDWEAHAQGIQLAAYSGASGTITGRGEPERLLGVRTAGGLFEMLRSRPLFGRTIRETDENPAADQVIVLAYGTWHRLFGEDRNILGTSLTVNGTPRTIVGVMPEDFRFPDGSTEFWVPARFDAEFRGNRDQYFLQVIGRLEPGTTLEQVRTRMATIADRLERDWPLFNTNLQIGVRPLRDTVVDGVETRLLILMGAVVFVLLITCANLGNLLLARATARRREIAIRQALGAGRGRVARQLLTESLVLALLGGAAGVAVGKGFLKLLLAAQATTNLPRVEEITLDERVLLFTLVVSILAGLFFGSL